MTFIMLVVINLVSVVLADRTFKSLHLPPVAQVDSERRIDSALPQARQAFYLGLFPAGTLLLTCSLAFAQRWRSTVASFLAATINTSAFLPARSLWIWIRAGNVLTAADVTNVWPDEHAYDADDSFLWVLAALAAFWVLLLIRLARAAQGPGAA